MKFFLLAAPALLLPTLFLMACTPTKATRGNLVDDYRIADITPGVSTASDVTRVMGSPTTTDPFDSNVWYYMGQKTEKRGIFDPKVTDERIIRVKIDPTTQMVTELAPLDTTRNEIPISSRTTPTSGNEMTAVQQMLGNLGKFNKKQTGPIVP